MDELVVELEPEPQDRKDYTEGGLMTSSALSMNDLVAILSNEVKHVNKLEEALVTIENSLLQKETLEQIANDPRQLSFFYQLLMTRKESSQRFLVKMMELGIKNNFLTRLLDGSGPKPVSGKGIPKPTRRVMELKAGLQKIIDDKRLGASGGQRV